MSRRLLTLVIVLVVLAGLVGAYFVVTRAKPVKAAAAQPELLKADKDKLVKIVLSDRTEGPLTLEKKGKAWAVGVPGQYALDQSSLDDLALTFTSLTAERMIDENPTDLKQFGLDPPLGAGGRDVQ